MRKTSLVLAVLLFSGCCVAQEEFVDWARDKTCQMVFHAVLEGLYTDGVSNEIVDIIIPPGDKQFKTHFVYACPLCHPAFEAFKLYRARPDFYARKEEMNTFGPPAISPGTIAQLKSKDRGERLEAIRGLIERWVERRLGSMRLTPEERNDWNVKLIARLKMGMQAMEKSDFDAKECAICRGSVDGSCKLIQEREEPKPAPKPIAPPKAPTDDAKEF